MTNDDIRYIHLPQVAKPRTIAYVRTNDRILFAWTVLNPKDTHVTYSREEGRNHAKSRLRSYHDALSMAFESNGYDINKNVMIVRDDRVGYIGNAAVRSFQDVTDIIADHVELGLKDFKHSFLTNIINRVVDEAING